MRRLVAALCCATALAAAAQGNDPDSVNQRLNARVARRDALWDRQKAAIERLDAAKAAQKAGEEPLPGDRTGIVGGHTRLNERYWARQADLQRAVDLAQEELDRVQDRLRQLGR